MKKQYQLKFTKHEHAMRFARWLQSTLAAMRESCQIVRVYVWQGTSTVCWQASTRHE